MRFRKNWGAIWQDGVILVLSVIVILSLFISALVRADGDIAVIACCFFWPIILFLIKWKMLYGPGFFVDMIELDERGVLLSTKTNSIFFHWTEVSKIVRTRYKGTNALALLNLNGEMIWFYRNGKIEKKLLELYPAAKQLLVNDNRFFLEEKIKNNRSFAVVFLRIIMLAWGLVVVFFLLARGFTFWLAPLYFIYLVLCIWYIFLVRKYKREGQTEGDSPNCSETNEKQQ